MTIQKTIHTQRVELDRPLVVVKTGSGFGFSIDGGKSNIGPYSHFESRHDGRCLLVTKDGQKYDPIGTSTDDIVEALDSFFKDVNSRFGIDFNWVDTKVDTATGIYTNAIESIKGIDGDEFISIEDFLNGSFKSEESYNDF